MWHSLRDVWSCPTKRDVRAAIHRQTGPLTRYLFPNTATGIESDKKDVCPYCDKLLEDIFQDLDEDIHECFADWEIRVEHLEFEHHFGKCLPDLKFYRLDLFLLHLAGCHELQLSDWTMELTKSCKREMRTPAEIVNGFVEGKDYDRIF